MAAIISLVAVLGVVGREPIQAAFERLFHYLPGEGMYVDEEENIYYEAEIINGEFEENDIHVRQYALYKFVQDFSHIADNLSDTA